MGGSSRLDGFATLEGRHEDHPAHSVRREEDLTSQRKRYEKERGVDLPEKTKVSVLEKEGKTMTQESIYPTVTIKKRRGLSTQKSFENQKQLCRDAPAAQQAWGGGSDLKPTGWDLVLSRGKRERPEGVIP